METLQSSSENKVGKTVVVVAVVGVVVVVAVVFVFKTIFIVWNVNLFLC